MRVRDHPSLSGTHFLEQLLDHLSVLEDLTNGERSRQGRKDPHGSGQFLRRFGMGMGMLSLAGLLGPELLSETARAEEILTLMPKDPPFPAKAKHVIYLFCDFRSKLFLRIY